MGSEPLSFGKVRDALLVVVALACVLCLAACASEDVAAKVGDEVISESSVTDYTADYRADKGLDNDADWAAYLADEGLTAKTWREQVVRMFAERMLVERKAQDLGIVADESYIDSQIEADVEAYGGRAEYEAALDAKGTNEAEQRDYYKLESLEMQLFAAELDLDDADTEKMVQEYMSKNLGDRVLRRYSVIVFDADDEKLAQGCLDELKSLKGEELRTRFAELARKYSTDEASAARDGDAGWNYGYSLVNEGEYVTLDEGELYGKLFAIADAEGAPSQYEIMLCTKKFAFTDEVTFADIDDEDLKAYVLQQASASRWAELSSDYLSNLIDAAQVQVRAMPAGLPYDV